MTLDSSTVSIKHEEPVYVTSSPGDDDAWGHPPVNQYIVVVRVRSLGEPIAGVYVPTLSLHTPSVIDPQLALEFAAWEAASDEALAHFEAKLD